MQRRSEIAIVQGPNGGDAGKTQHRFQRDQVVVRSSDFVAEANIGTGDGQNQSGNRGPAIGDRRSPAETHRQSVS